MYKPYFLAHIRILLPVYSFSQEGLQQDLLGNPFIFICYSCKMAVKMVLL